MEDGAGGTIDIGMTRSGDELADLVGQGEGKRVSRLVGGVGEDAET